MGLGKKIFRAIIILVATVALGLAAKIIGFGFGIGVAAGSAVGIYEGFVVKEEN